MIGDTTTEILLTGLELVDANHSLAVSTLNPARAPATRRIPTTSPTSPSSVSAEWLTKWFLSRMRSAAMRCDTARGDGCRPAPSD
jgi:hypothetical protein